MMKNFTIFALGVWLGITVSQRLEAGEQKNKDIKDPNFGVTYSTKLDFDSTLIDGKMKAPTGFYLQGRNKQSLSNMVNLRSNFKAELKGSRSGVKAASY